MILYTFVSGLHTSMMSSSRSQNLGVVVYLLQQSTQQLLAALDSHKHHARKYTNIANLTAEEVREVSYGGWYTRIHHQQPAASVWSVFGTKGYLCGWDQISFISLSLSLSLSVHVTTVNLNICVLFTIYHNVTALK